MSDFLLPDLGEGIVECEVVKWLVAEGDSIAEDQPVVEVSTDKAVMEITAPDAGRVTRLYCGEGQTARVHAPLFAYVVSEDTATHTDSAAASPAARAPAPEAATPDTEIPQPPAPQDEQTPQDEQAPLNEPTLQDEPAPAAAKPFLLPDLGEGIVECEVVAWQVAEGEEIAEDQPVVEVSTDKAVMEITAPEAGRLARHHCQVGESARVHTPLFTYHPATSETSTASGTTTDTVPGAAADVSQSASQSTALASVSRGTSAPAASPTGRRRIPASPAVRRRVRELGLTLDEIPGSGKDGRVLKEDVLAFQQRRDSAAETAQPAAERGDENQSQAQSQPPTAGEPAAEDRIEPLKGIRAVMARRMSEAAASIPTSPTATSSMSPSCWPCASGSRPVSPSATSGSP
ncbi:biotin/lipoyl-containing protein [Salinicola sp. JS01]|uniref:biotin/lipoyl-containing protein n=1 Tax=Salinicola sp. JS01 TaxID=3050071 RepID=UPI00255BA618|nr:biotin/lipoyl-containing protein [Salinicola sp. JS01]WIX32751.1 biotin/lipoyl-containing protein [Salinicola sp. JS01]